MQIIFQYKNKWLLGETQKNLLKETDLTKDYKGQLQGKGMILQEYYHTEDESDILFTDSSLNMMKIRCDPNLIGKNNYYETQNG